MKANDMLIKQIAEVVDDKIATRLEPVLNRLEALEKGQKKQGKQLTSIKKTLDVAIDHFDRRDIKVQKRVSRIENHLVLPVLE